jgi:dTDP-4-dehydrorhamnose reductase
MRLLVTGANGQIGRELARSLMPLGHVTAMDHDAFDLARPETLPGIVRGARPDVLVNAAGYTAVDKAEREESLATLINATAVGVLARTAREIGALLVHYSTDYVFDGAKDGPYVEDDPPGPLNAYGRSKLGGETAIRGAGGDHLILRTSWVYAARGRNFLTTIERLAREGKQLRVVADQVGAPTWARNLADATAHVIRQARQEQKRGQFRSDILHMTAAGSTSWHGFAQAILQHAPARPPACMSAPEVQAIASRDYAAPAIRPKNSVLCCKRLHERFELALPDWRVGLASCLADDGTARQDAT